MDQVRKSFNSKFRPKRNYQRSSYQVRPIVTISSNSFALIEGWNCVKSLRITKIIKQIKFKKTWGELAANRVSRDNHGEDICDKL